jgi:plasmid stability protein
LDAFCIRFETMATLTIKNMPDELYAALTHMAKKNRRSINSEAIVRLERAMEVPTPETDALIENIRKNREEMLAKGVWLTDEILERAKNEGRA